MVTRVGFVTSALLKRDGRVFDGGAERQLYQLARFASDLGVEVIVYQAGEELLTRDFENFVVRSIPTRHSPISIAGVSQASSDKCHFVHHQYSPRPWRIAAKLPASATQFGVFWDIPYEPRARDWYPISSLSRPALSAWRRSERFLWLESVRRLHALLADDSGILRIIQSHRPHLRERVHVALNFCDLPNPTEEPVPQGEESEGTRQLAEARDRGVTTVLVPRNISLVRGIWWLPDIVERVLNKVDSAVVFVVTGVYVPFHRRSARYERALRWRLERAPAEVRSAIRFSGGIPHSEMGKAYRLSDIVLIPSFAHEGSSLAAIEAMSFARPVIATNIGGLNDVVDDRATGWLVHPRVEAIADAVVELIERPDLRVTLGVNARARAQTCFSLENWRERVYPFIQASGWLG